MALNCRVGRRLSRQLSGVKRTRQIKSAAAVYDPKRTSGIRFCCDAQRRLPVIVSTCSMASAREGFP